jgi:hypothetical protein
MVRIIRSEEKESFLGRKCFYNQTVNIIIPYLGKESKHYFCSIFPCMLEFNAKHYFSLGGPVYWTPSFSPYSLSRMVIVGNKVYNRRKGINSFGLLVCRLSGRRRETNTGRMTNMANKVYQAKAGDGVKKMGIKRVNSFFGTPGEAVSEALALKEKIDAQYKNKIKWDYDGSLTGSTKKLKILKGYLNGNHDSHPFYLEILSVEPLEHVQIVSPIKPKSVTLEDQKVVERVAQLFN